MYMSYHFAFHSVPEISNLDDILPTVQNLKLAAS